RPEDHWPGLWARAYVDFAAGEKRAWLHEQGMRFFPVVGWAERGDGRASGHGNSVPRFHIVWGTGPGVVEPFLRKAIRAEQEGLLRFAFRHQVDELTVHDGVVTGVSGTALAPATQRRGVTSNRDRIGGFALSAQAVIVTSGGIGGNHELVRQTWPARLGPPPARMVTGVPAHVDGRMLGISERAGASLINRDRMWHYVEGIHNWDPIWPGHAIRILPGPSSMWFDGNGHRLPPPLFPGFDTLGTLAHLRTTGHDHSWFVLNQTIIEKEFGLSGSEQNPDLTGRSVRQVIGRATSGIPGPVQAFLDRGEDFVQATTVGELVAKMNALTPEAPLDPALIERQIADRDAQLDNDFSKDAQVTAIHGARSYRGDKLTRVATPHKLLDPRHGPLIAVRLSVLTRKTLGGLQTDLEARALTQAGTPVPGLYAAGEVAGFGGGGMHGYRSLEGTFLGGCIFSGRTAGRAAAAAI
ncbi:MAG: FAD-binding dehydrogenase, partial [Lapillicoccus sp.]